MHKKNIKAELRENGVTKKIPDVFEIKWPSYYQAATFIEENIAIKNQILLDHKDTAIRFKHYDQIPECWRLILEDLKPLTQYICYVQTDSYLLKDSSNITSQFSINGNH